ncbi:MAG: response regulator transcription factor [Bdellovibrio sp.]|nr:response regulator transcription factor [Bdellovibrio sp.]
MKLLLVEDDIRLAEHLVSNLRDHGFLVKHISDKEGLEYTFGESDKIDAIILDRLLGNFDSKQALPKIRKKWSESPILILSAISTPNERTDLLNMGADDYLGKPFSTQELIARLRALLRRRSTPNENFIQIGNLMINSIKRIISVGDSFDVLPAKEFLLLLTLCQEPGRVWSKDDLLDYIWGHANEVETNVVEATITNLRKKLSEIGANLLIRNMRNTGYWIEA